MSRRHSSRSDAFATSMHSVSIPELCPSYPSLSFILDLGLDFDPGFDFDFDPDLDFDFDSDSVS